MKHTYKQFEISRLICRQLENQLESFSEPDYLAGEYDHQGAGMKEIDRALRWSNSEKRFLDRNLKRAERRVNRFEDRTTPRSQEKFMQAKRLHQEVEKRLIKFTNGKLHLAFESAFDKMGDYVCSDPEWAKNRLAEVMNRVISEIDLKYVNEERFWLNARKGNVFYNFRIRNGKAVVMCHIEPVIWN